jgi:hypothetical protein
VIDDAIRQFQEPQRQPGARVPTPAPSRAAPSVATIGRDAPAPEGRQRIEARLLTTAGPAHTETGNVWHHTPQLEMEIGCFMEQAYVLNASGSITIDPNIANVWNVSLAGTATLSFAAPVAIPQDQIDAGRDRNRATGIVLRVIRNGHDYAFSGIEVATGTADRVRADANRDKWVADWWGGPDLGSNWELQLVASGYEPG